MPNPLPRAFFTQVPTIRAKPFPQRERICYILCRVTGRNESYLTHLIPISKAKFALNTVNILPAAQYLSYALFNFLVYHPLGTPRVGPDFCVNPPEPWAQTFGKIPGVSGLGRVNPPCLKNKYQFSAV